MTFCRLLPKEPEWKYCYSCKNRIITKTIDTHCICVKCGGLDCSIDVQCNECADLLDKQMSTYVKLRAKLEGKSRGRVLCKTVSSVCEDSFVSLSDVPSD